MAKLVRLPNDKAGENLVKLAKKLGVTQGVAVEWLVNDAMARILAGNSDDVIYRLAQLNQPCEPMLVGGENQGGY